MTFQPGEHRYVSVKCRACGFVYDVPMNCGDRLCPLCCRRRFGVLLNRYKEFFEQLQPGACRFFTVTLVNQPDLESMHKKLLSCVGRLIAYGKKNWGWQGGVTGYQATNKGKGWHDHAHLIVAGGRFVPYDELVKVWLSITGDSWNASVRFVLNPENDLRYILSYTLDNSGVWAEFRDEYNRVFKGRRLLQSWGTWFNRMNADDDGENVFLCPKCGESTWISNFEVGFFTEGASPLLVPLVVGSSP